MVKKMKDYIGYLKGQPLIPVPIELIRDPYLTNESPLFPIFYSTYDVAWLNNYISFKDYKLWLKR